MEHTVKFNKKHNDPYKKHNIRKRLTRIHFTTEELQKDEQKWSQVLSDIDNTYDGFIYYDEFERAIIKFRDRDLNQELS